MDNLAMLCYHEARANVQWSKRYGHFAVFAMLFVVVALILTGSVPLDVVLIAAGAALIGTVIMFSTWKDILTGFVGALALIAILQLGPALYHLWVG